MPAAVTDKFTKVGNPGSATTLSSPGYTIGDTQITVGSTTNWPTDTKVIFAIDRAQVVNGTEERIAGTYCEFEGIVNGANTIQDLTKRYGTAQNYSAGSLTRVYIPVASTRENDLIDGLDVEHNLDGTHDDAIVGLLAEDQTFTGVKTFDNIKFNAPQGFLLNGKISRTVASNNITVAIKTLSGSDPSATSPVFVRIGDTIRSITAALSVTKNAGTNWMNAGATGLATNELDYFVYLGYNATDGVVIGFSRIPYANKYSDFSATTTNDKYCAISTITNAASTDEYENIGRFNATLSATASFNWSVPATSVIVNRPILETRWLNHGVAGNFTGYTLGNGTLFMQYKICGDQLVWKFRTVLGTTSSLAANSDLIVDLPMALPSTGNNQYTSPLGQASFNDGSTIYRGSINYYSTSQAVLQGSTVTGANLVQNNVDSDEPFTWGNTDSIDVFVTGVPLI